MMGVWSPELITHQGDVYECGKGGQRKTGGGVSVEEESHAMRLRLPSCWSIQMKRAPSLEVGVTLAVLMGCGGGGDGGATGSGAPAPPRLIAPLSTATVTSQRPTLKWQLANGTDGAHVQICRDRACTSEVTAFDARGASGAPASDLPPGVVFWRAYGRGGGVTGQVSTPTWQFTVGARSAPVDTSWGTTLDVNGDGYADVIVGAPSESMTVGIAHVYLGSAAGLASTPAVTLNPPGGQYSDFGSSVASAGDVNGDGYGDVIVGANGASGGVYVYLGSATGLA
jgi:FG-GAP-like repeat